MKRTILLCLVLVGLASLTHTHAQRYELGAGLGFTGFLGDLGGAQDIARPFVVDLDMRAFRPIGTVFFRHTFKPRWAYKVSFSAGQVFGDDGFIYGDNNGGRKGRANTALIEGTVNNDFSQWIAGDYDEWFRWIRNQQFKSPVVDVTGVIEFNLMQYEPRSIRKRWTPYLQAGLGFLAFNPKGRKYQGELTQGGNSVHGGQWIKLQPLGTEGQSNPAVFANGERKYGRNLYKRFAGELLMGAGIKYNINRNWQIGFDLMHRMTTTDFLDDVSGNYLDPRDIDAFPPTNGSDPQDIKDFGVYNARDFYEDLYRNAGGYFSPAGLVARQRRQDPVDVAFDPNFDPEGEYNYIEFVGDYSWMVRTFGPNVQRGDNTDFDQFFSATVTVTYMFGRNTYSCYFKN